MAVNSPQIKADDIDNSAVKAALRIVLIYLGLAGTGLLLLPLLNRDVQTFRFHSTHYIQDFIFLLLTSILLFFLIYRLIKKQNQHKNQARHNEIRYRSLFNNMKEGASMYRPTDNGQDFVLVDINYRGKKLDHIDGQKFSGYKATKVATGTANTELFRVMQRVCATGTPEHLQLCYYEEEQLNKCRDNYIFRLETGEIVTLYDDVTDKKQLEDKLKQSEQELSLQNTILTQFLTSDDDGVYQEILHILTSILKSSFGYFANINNKDLLIGTSINTEVRDQNRIVDRDIISITETSNTILKEVVTTGKTIVTNSKLSSPMGNKSLKNGIMVSIRHQEKIIGIICIGNKEKAFTATDQSLLENICSHIAPILKARLWAQHIEKLHFNASAELIKSESNLKKAEQLAKIGHWEHDILKDTLTWSSEVYRIFSLDPAEYTPSVESFMQMIHPDDQELVNQEYLQSVKDKSTYDIIHRVLLHNGQVKFVHELSVTTYNKAGEAIRSLGTVQDISERIQAEESNRRLATAIDQANDVIVITDPQGLIQYVNPAFEQLTEYTQQEAIGQNPRILQSGKHSPSYYRKLWNTINSGKVWHGKLTNKTKNGKLFTEEASITPIKDDTGKIINFVAVKHDISRELELEQQLRQAAKMEAIGTLAGGIAHDFNNILGAILGYTRMAMDDLAKESQPYQDLSHVIQSGDRAANLIKQILLFSRHQKQGFVPVQIQFIIKEAIKMLRASLPSTIILKETIQEDCPSIMADPSQIHQILMNLCTNAKQAMLAKGGTLSISLTKMDISDPDHTTVAGLNDGEYVKISVCDTGQGIEKENLNRIFDPFYSTKGIKEGTGLGLAVTHGIVKSHHGIITVDSEPQKGSSFTIFLPAAPMEHPQEQQQDKTNIPGGDEHILVVDDEHAILIIRERLLLKLGYRVTTFSSSIEALRSFREDSFQYDLLLTDMTMPKMNGKELTENLLTIRPNLPVIVCTGHSDLIDDDKAHEYGMRALLYKPIKPLILAKAIRKALD